MVLRTKTATNIDSWKKDLEVQFSQKNSAFTRIYKKTWASKKILFPKFDDLFHPQTADPPTEVWWRFRSACVDRKQWWNVHWLCSHMAESESRLFIDLRYILCVVSRLLTEQRASLLNYFPHWFIHFLRLHKSVTCSWTRGNYCSLAVFPGKYAARLENSN